jgi:hypothetical protein
MSLTPNESENIEMTKKPVTPGEPTATYEAPKLVRYGALFVETATKVPCTNPHSDGGSDVCDADNGPIDGPK